MIRAAVFKGVFGTVVMCTALTAYADCKTSDKIQIANMTFASASIMANIDNLILSKGYGCNTELVPGDTVPTATTMATKGVPQVGPEMWMTNISEILQEGEKKGNLVIAGDVIATGGVEGWWIPKYLSEQYPDLKSVADLPKYAKLFADPNDPGKGRFFNCPPGWGCEIVNNNLFKAYKLGDSYNLVSPGSGAAMDATIASAYKRKLPWVGYYWGPTAILGKYDMVQLQMNPPDTKLDACNRKADCTTPHAGAFSNVRIVTAVATSLQKSEPEVYTFLSKVSLDIPTYNKLLSWGEENKAEPKETAEYFIKNFPDVWKQWVTEDAASKISKS